MINKEKFKRFFSKQFIIDFFRTYGIDLIFYLYITFGLYGLMLVSVNIEEKFFKIGLSVLWTIIFIPILILKLKKDNERSHFNYNLEGDNKEKK